MKRARMAAAALAALLLLAGTALAQNEGGGQTGGTSGTFLATEGDWLSIGLGFGVSDTPYKSYDTQWMPLPIISYEGLYAYIRGMKAGVKIINFSHVEFSAFVGYNPTSFDASDTSNRKLRKLDDRHSSAEAGLEARVLTPIGMLFANAAGDIAGNSDGFQGRAGYSNSWEFGRLEVAPTAGLAWSSSDYNDYYYGVSGSEARKSGLKAYDAGAGVSPFVGAHLSYDITDNWGIFCNGEVTFLNSEIKDSPMVDKKRVHSLTGGVVYDF